MTPKKPNKPLNFRSVPISKPDPKLTKKSCNCGRNKHK
jgi:hypothetical protein